MDKDLSLVRVVEIELNSFCNRTCSWCPNKFIDRTKSQKINLRSYKKLLLDLVFFEAGKNSGLTVSFSRNNEPFYDIEHLKFMVDLARNLLPSNTRLVSNTNGDYLTNKSFKNLKLDEVSIMDYNSDGLEKCVLKLNKLGAINIDADYPFIKAKIEDTDILYYVDWSKFHKIEDRAGLLGDVSKGEIVPRKAKCLEPIYFIAIDYNGNVMSCCNLRSDAKQHSKLILGNIYAQDINSIYHSRAATKFRKKLSSGHRLFYPNVCKTCTKKPGRYTRDKGGINYE